MFVNISTCLVANEINALIGAGFDAKVWHDFLEQCFACFGSVPHRIRPRPGRSLTSQCVWWGWCAPHTQKVGCVIGCGGLSWNGVVL